MARSIRFLAAILFALPLPAADRRAADEALVAEMRRSHVRVEGERAVVWVPASWPKDRAQETVAMLEQAVTGVEKTLGRAFDAEAYRQRRIEFFISDSDDVPSHVIGGYDHDAASDAPYVFLSGLGSDEAPHLHETAHIIAGNYGSLLLREGIATYAQFTIKPGPMRPLAKIEGVVDLATLDAAMPELLAGRGARARAEAWLASPVKNVRFQSRPERGLFYAVSASFVAHLMSELGMEAFMRVHAQSDVAAALETESGKPWRKWAEEWLAKHGSQNRAAAGSGESVE